MRYRQIGQTELEVSEVGFGLWTVATDWWGERSDEEAVALLRKAYDLGINFFDASDRYGRGRAERLLGEAFRERREMVVIATKGGYDITQPADASPPPQAWTPEYIRSACEASLERLQTDYIDLYQLHDPPMAALQDDALWSALAALRDEGKVRYVGVALGPGIGWQEEGEYALRRRDITTLATAYNLLEQWPGRKFFTVALETTAGILVRMPHAAGVLDGRTTLETGPDPRNPHAPRSQAFVQEALQKVEKFRPFYEPKGMDLGQAAIKFCLAEEAVVSVLPDITDEERLVAFAEAPELPDFDPLEIAELAEMYRRNFDVAPVGED